jgi:hypothetical protein
LRNSSSGCRRPIFTKEKAGPDFGIVVQQEVDPFMFAVLLSFEHDLLATRDESVIVPKEMYVALFEFHRK